MNDGNKVVVAAAAVGVVAVAAAPMAVGLAALGYVIYRIKKSQREKERNNDRRD